MKREGGVWEASIREFSSSPLPSNHDPPFYFNWKRRKMKNKMKKTEFIERYGEAAYQKQLEQGRAYYRAHIEQENARNKKYREEHPEEVKTYQKGYRETHREEEKARVKKWQDEHPEEVKTHNKEYRETHPEEVIASNQERGRKGGSHYEQKLEYDRTGIRGERNKVRVKSWKQYKPYKNKIDPLNLTQLHHLWVDGTAEYTGLALVEKDQHARGIIDIIEVLEGSIDVFTERGVEDRGITHPYQLFDVFEITDSGVRVFTEDELREQGYEVDTY